MQPRLHAALVAASGVALIYALWCVPYVPTHDGPNHLASCVLANRMEDPDSPLHKYLEYGAPVSNLGFQSVCQAAESVFGWRLGFRVSITIVALIWALGFAYLISGIEKRSPLVLFGFATALSWSFYLGIFSFVIGIGLTFFVLGVAVRRGVPKNVGGWAVVALCVLGIAIVHSFAAALCGIALGASLVFRGNMKEAPRTVLGLILAGAPALALCVLGRSAGDVGTTDWRDFATRVIELPALFVGGPAWRSVPPLSAAVVGLAFGVRAMVRGGIEPAQRGLVIVAAAGFVVYLSTPFHLASWAYFSPRFALFAPAIAIAAVPPRVVRGWLAYVVFGAMTFGSIGWSVAHHRALEPAVDEALAGLDAPIRRSAGRLPLMLSSAGDRSGMLEVEPLVMILHLYLLDQGGVDPYIYASFPNLDRVVFQEDPKNIFGYFPARYLKNDLACAGRDEKCPPLDVQYEWFAIYGRAFEDTLIFADDPAVLATFRARGYAVDFNKGRLAIVHPQACRIDPVLHGAGGPVHMRFGHTKIDTPTIDAPYDAARGPLIGPDCGSLWIEFTASDGRRCAEGARLTFTSMPDAPARVECTLSEQAR